MDSITTSVTIHSAIIITLPISLSSTRLPHRLIFTITLFTIIPHFKTQQLQLCSYHLTPRVNPPDVQTTICPCQTSSTPNSPRHLGMEYSIPFLISFVLLPTCLFPFVFHDPFCELLFSTFCNFLPTIIASRSFCYALILSFSLHLSFSFR